MWKNALPGPSVLALWTAPRSRSTAFLRMMAQREDFTILHEPFSRVVDFGSTIVGGREVRGERELIVAIGDLARCGPVFFKDTTDFRYPGLLANDVFLAAVTHTFLIRPPDEILASYYALNPRLRAEDVGIDRLAEIFDAVTERTGRTPVVVDSADLIRNPRGTVRAYCEAAGIRYLPDALTWEPGMLPQWERTGRWHRRVAETDGFTATSTPYPDTAENNAMLNRYHARQLPFYEKLLAYKLPVPER